MATSRLDGHKYALKVMKHRYSNLDKIKKDKEIKALKSLAHPNIIKLIDVLYDQAEGTSLAYQEKMALVFELMDCNLYELYKNKKSLFSLEKIRAIGHDIL